MSVGRVGEEGVDYGKQRLQGIKRVTALITLKRVSAITMATETQ